MKKRVLSILLAFAMLIGVVPGAMVSSESASGVNDVTLSLGSFYSGVIKNNGSLWTWGYNPRGNLGDGKTGRGKNIPEQIMQDVKSISFSGSKSAAITKDGTLWMWGSLGQGHSASKPKKIMENVSAVCVAEDNVAVIKNDNSLWTWGNNCEGRLGRGNDEENTIDIFTPVKIMEDVLSVSVSHSHSVAIKADGSLWEWGKILNIPEGYSNTPIKVMDNVVYACAGETESAAITKKGELYMWGSNELQYNGKGYFEEINPTKIMDNIKYVTFGNGVTAVIKNDNSLWIWGPDGGADIIEKTYETKNNPVKIMDHVETVQLGYNHIAAVRKDGTLWIWGNNQYGQIGDGTNESKFEPVKVMDNVMVSFSSESIDGVQDSNNFSNLPQNLEMDFYGDEKIISVDVPNAKFEIEDKKIAKLEKSIRVLNVGQKEQTSSDFKIIPLSPGNTTITISTSDGRKAECNLTVTGAKIVLNGEQLSFDQPPINTNGRLLVPIRKISESMGRSVYWNQEIQTALIDNETEALLVPLYSDTLYKADGHAFASWKQVSLDVPALMSNDRILVPIRAICENLDANVEWDSKYSTAYITFDDTVTKNLMSDSLFDSINLIYYLNNFSLTEFEKCSDDLNYFYDNRNHSIDAMTMGFSDPWAGVKDIASMISGSDNATNIIRQCLYDVLAEISENQKSSSFEIVKAINDTVSTGIDIYSEMGGLDVNLRVANKHLDTFDYYLKHEYKSKYKDTADSLINIGIFTAEELSYIFTEYTTNLEYLDIFRESLADAGYSDETLENAFSQLEYEYTDKFVGVLVHLRDALAEDGFSKALSTVIGDGSFGLGNAVWNVWFNAIGVTKKGEALKTFYGIYCFDNAVNRALTSKVIAIKTSEQKEISKLKSLIQFVKAEKIAAYNAMKIIDNDKKSDLYIDECISKIQNWSYYIWER